MFKCYICNGNQYITIMSTYLSMTVIGRLGSDLQNSMTKNGINYVNMSIAHSIPILNKEASTWSEQTVWIRATFWGKIEKIENFKKGSLILIEGTPSAELYTPKDGSAPQPLLSLSTYRQPKVLVRPTPSQPYATPANPPSAGYISSQAKAIPVNNGSQEVPFIQENSKNDLPF